MARSRFASEKTSVWDHSLEERSKKSSVKNYFMKGVRTSALQIRAGLHFGAPDLQSILDQWSAYFRPGVDNES